MENKELNNENTTHEEKPFNFGKFIFGIFIGLLILTGIIIMVPYFLMKQG
jgi:flagellar biogenesis protein FliO